MQITALSLGLTKHLSNILADETENAVGGPQVHPDVPSLLTNNTENLKDEALGHILTSILPADFGSLEKVINHKGRSEAASQAAKAYTAAISMALSEVSTQRLDR